MTKNGIPTARWASFTDSQRACQFIERYLLACQLEFCYYIFVYLHENRTICCKMSALCCKFIYPGGIDIELWGVVTQW